jgi:hypothetical protein
MEARQRVKFTGVELAGGAELAAPMEKATAVLWREGDAGRRSRGMMEREARWRAPSRRVGTALR